MMKFHKNLTIKVFNKFLYCLSISPLFKVFDFIDTILLLKSLQNVFIIFSLKTSLKFFERHSTIQKTCREQFQIEPPLIISKQTYKQYWNKYYNVVYSKLIVSILKTSSLGKGKIYMYYKMLLLHFLWSLVQKRKWEVWCLVIILVFKLPKFVLNTYLMNQKAFSVEYSR